MVKVIGGALPIGGVYNATPPTGEDEHILPLQVDENGNLKVSGLDGGGESLEAEYNATLPVLDDTDTSPLQLDVNGNLKSTLATQIAGEDLTRDVMKTEQRFSFTRLTADGQVKAGAGFLHTLTFACADAAPTAGSIIVYDSLTETGTVIYSETFDTTAFRGFSVILDVAFSTGLYVGFTTTNDVGITASYR